MPLAAYAAPLRALRRWQRSREHPAHMGGLLLPICAEMGAPVLGRFGISTAAWVFWICVSLDAYTDYPRVADLLAPYTPTGGWWQVPFFVVARMIVLFFATLGLELYVAVTSVIVLALLLRGLALSASGGRRMPT